MENFTHKSVLLKESIDTLLLKPNGVYLDLTFGRGGHSKRILETLTSGTLIAFDKDPEAIAYGKKYITHSSFELVHDDFSNAKEIITNKGLLGKIDGILLDLGVSSPQLDDEMRGFSFTKDAYLDMRMDTTRGIDAKSWLEQNNEENIANALYTYGEEKKSRIIARKIKEFQMHKTLTTTTQLSNIVSSVVRSKTKHPATRTFQAIRIAVNNELNALEKFLISSHELLKPSGILSIITFHSLEDRIVKSFFKKYSVAPYVHKNLPAVEFIPLFASIKKIKPTEYEINENPRSRSALLRTAVRC